MRHVITRSLAAAIVLVVGVYLVGQRLDARFTGGQGQITPCLATAVDGDQPPVARGEIMSSPTDTYAKYELCDGTLVYLDTNTQIRLSEYPSADDAYTTQLELIQGRIIVDGYADVRARNAVFAVKPGNCELVHYSWLDQLDVTPWVDAACQEHGSQALPITRATTRYNTFDGSQIANLPFDPSTSTARNFYTWVGLDLNLKTLP